MPDGWVIVFDSEAPQPCSDRALVMLARDIPYEILRADGRSTLWVPASFGERAKYEIWQYEQENRRIRSAPLPPPPDEHDGVPGVIAYIVVICGVAWLAGEGAFNRDWLAAGRVDGERIRDGEWWRLVTALTLHSGLRHLLGNIGFGALFGFLAGRLAGSGMAWLVIVLASAAANALNTFLLDPSHRSIGASTAVFAALGLVAGYVWCGRFMAQDRWAYRLGPIVGGIALLAFTGTGDENTDIGAHLAGFVCGFVAGIITIRMTSLGALRHVQLTCGAAAVAIVTAAWIFAFHPWTAA
ncbi:MAG TPA: rhomboid family intramembrane serine protease [Woeseiaceae bacterium]